MKEKKHVFLGDIGGGGDAKHFQETASSLQDTRKEQPPAGRPEVNCSDEFMCIQGIRLAVFSLPCQQMSESK